MKLTVGSKFEVKSKYISIIDRIVGISSILQKIDDRLRKYKPIHLCWLFDKLGLPTPRYLVGEASIDVGSVAIGRPSWAGNEETHISSLNPANASGVLTAIDVYVLAAGNLKVGVFYVISGDTLKCRSAANLGYLSAGLHSNIAVNLSIQAGDYLGCFFDATCRLEMDTVGSTYWLDEGDYCVVGVQHTYISLPTRTLSLYGTGVTIPTAPSGCTAHYVATNNAKCTWTDNSGIETNFRIERAIDGGGWVFWKNVGANVQDSGTYTLGANHRIAFRVLAYNAAGSSSWSTSGYTYTTPSAPTNCAIALGTINVTWTDNSAYEEGFQVERQLDDGGWGLVHTTAAEAESWADASQPTGANVKYEYRVRAKKGTLYSAYSTSNVIFAKSFSENIALSDSYSRVWSIHRTFSENIALSDSYSRVCTWYRTFTESINLSDTVSKAVSKAFSEIVTLSDTIKKKVAKIFPETITLTDTIKKKVYKTFPETITLTDTIKKKVYKTFPETITLTDTLKKKITKIFTESINLSDTYSRIWHIYRTFTEKINLADSLVKKTFKTFKETIKLTDTYSRVVNWYRTFTEKITLTDTVRKVKSNLVQLWKKLMNLFDIKG